MGSAPNGSGETGSSVACASGAERFPVIISWKALAAELIGVLGKELVILGPDNLLTQLFAQQDFAVDQVDGGVLVAPNRRVLFQERLNRHAAPGLPMGALLGSDFGDEVLHRVTRQ